MFNGNPFVPQPGMMQTMGAPGLMPGAVMPDPRMEQINQMMAMAQARSAQQVQQPLSPQIMAFMQRIKDSAAARQLAGGFGGEQQPLPQGMQQFGQPIAAPLAPAAPLGQPMPPAPPPMMPDPRMGAMQPQFAAMQQPQSGMSQFGGGGGTPNNPMRSLMPQNGFGNGLEMPGRRGF